jgi:putative ABC transport system substrate-binding protein
MNRILREGAKPGGLPIQLPAKFAFAVNLKTAKALRLTIPQSLLMRADQILECSTAVPSWLASEPNNLE